MKADGDCGPAAFNEAVRLEEAGFEGVRVVHGEVHGDGVPRHFHAWVEFSQWHMDMARDVSNGHDVTIFAAAYHRIGKVTQAHAYTVAEARALVVEHGTWGPWGWDTSTGL